MKSKVIMAASVLLAAMTTTYSNYFTTDLHFGDYTLVRDNPAIRTLSNVPRFFYDVSTSATDPVDYGYRPIVTLSFAIDHLFGWGVNPFALHLSTFLVFLMGLAAIAWLFFSTFERTLPHPWNPYLAIMATALFGLHPAVAEMLNPINERGELFAALGVVGGIALYAGLPRQRHLFLYLIPPMAGVLSNPAGLIFGPMLLLYILLIEAAPARETEHSLSAEQTRSYDQTQTPITAVKSTQGPKRIRIRRRKHPFRRYLKMQMERFMPALVFTVTAGILHSFVTPFRTTGESVISYWFTQPWVALRYFRSFFVPSHLSPASDLSGFASYDIHAVAGLVFVIVLVSVALILAVSPHWRPAVFGIWWFLLAWLPGAMLMQADIEKDTRMFLPFVGLALGLTWTARMLLPSGEPLRRLEAIVACMLLCAVAYGTYTRNRVWSSEEALWRDCVDKNPESVRGLQNYATVLLEKGRAADAYELLRKARQINPNAAGVEAVMGSVSAALNRQGEAERHFNRALMLGADRAANHYPYAVWLEKQGIRDRAKDEYSWASSLAHSDLRPRYGLMRLANATGDWNNLRSTVEEAQTVAPRDPGVERFAKIVENHPDTMKDALQLVKEHPTAENYLTLADVYCLAGEYEKCLGAAQKALELRPNNPAAFINIGAAYISLGRLDEAIATAKQALAIDPDNKIARDNLEAWERHKLVVGSEIMRK